MDHGPTPRPEWADDCLSDEGWLVFASLWEAALAARRLEVRDIDRDGSYRLTPPPEANVDEGEEMVLGLEAIVRASSHVARGDWPGMIERHLDHMLEVALVEDFRIEQVRVRLAGEDPARRIPSLLGIAPDLAVALVADFPNAVAYIRVETAASKLGLEPTALLDRATANLAEALQPRLTRIPGTQLYSAIVAEGEQGSYGASALLVLKPADFVGAGCDPARGALIAVPTPDLCVVEPIPAEGPYTLIPELLRLTAQVGADATRRLSSGLLWYHDGGMLSPIVPVRPVETDRDDGVPVVLAPPSMLERFGQPPMVMPFDPDAPVA